MSSFFTRTKLVILLLSLISCRNSDEASVFKPGRTWVYDVEITDSLNTVVDTFTLIMSCRESSLSEKIIRPITVCYEYKKSNTIIDNECTGVIDNINEISLHPPRRNVLEFTEVLPFPRVSKPIGNGFTSSIDLYIQKASYWDKGKNKTINLAGMKIKQELSSADFDTTRIAFEKENLLCYKSEGKNLNYVEKLGQFRVSYFFNEKYGYIKWIYLTPWEETVTISLRKVDF